MLGIGLGLSSLTILSGGVVAPVSYPDQTNTGPTNAVGYPGSLTALATASIGNVTATYNFRDINVGSAGFDISGTGTITFNGCRIQGNPNAALLTPRTGMNLVFNDCEFRPLVSDYPTPPGTINTSWPCDQVGTQVTGVKGYLYAVKATVDSGSITLNRCNAWGGANPFMWARRTATNFIVMNDCWVHDAREYATFSDHTDGWGDTESEQVDQSYATCNHNTIASRGSTQGIAVQSSTPDMHPEQIHIYDHITMTNNYLSGFGYMVDPGFGRIASTNMVFKDNIFSSYSPPIYGFVYQTGISGNDQTDLYSQPTNMWARNKFKFIAGTAPAGTATVSWGAGDDGKYVWPDNSLHVTDFVKQTVTLANLILDHQSWTEGASAGSAIGNITNGHAGSTYSFSSTRIAASGQAIVVGSTASTAGTYSIDITETNSLATPTTHTTTISFTVDAASVPAVAFNKASHSTASFFSAATTFDVGSTNANTAIGTITAGQLLVAVTCVSMSSGDTGTITAPAGWTSQFNAMQNISGDLYRVAVHTKIAGGSETGSYTFNWTNSCLGGSWSLLVFDSPGASFLDALTSAAKGDFAATIACPSATATVAGALLVSIYTEKGGRNPYAVASGQTDRSNNVSNQSYIPAIVIGTEVLSASGATGTRTGTMASGNNTFGVSMVLK